MKYSRRSCTTAAVEDAIRMKVHPDLVPVPDLTSRRRMQCTMTMTKPCSESKTAKRIWNRMERLSVMASTADIQVSASRGRTTQELHRDALAGEEEVQKVNHFLLPSVFWVIPELYDIWPLSIIY